MPESTSSSLRVAYFTMEIGLNAKMPTYAGGLGMLAGDLMRSCADMEVSAACITMRWQHGYMQQHINPDGTQNYEDTQWNPQEFMEKRDEKIVVQIEGRDVVVGCFEYKIQGSSNAVVPVFFLDTDLPENSEEDRLITNHLYGGDGYMRLKQEVVLGIGGVKMLRALGYSDIGTFHMNEGHAAFLTLAVLRECEWDNEKVKKHCAFTTHTPVKAGHDAFPYEMAYQVAGDQLPWHIKDIAGQDALSMTHLAMNMSHYTCGVSKIHGEVSRNMFPGYDIDAITNGVHLPTWVSPHMDALLKEHSADWQDKPEQLAECINAIEDEKVWGAHLKAKKDLIDYVNLHTDEPFDTDHLTIATARRVVSYKRPELLYTNLERLKEVCCGRIQIIHAGNAHPSDEFGQSVIQRMIERSKTLKDCVRIVYLENYNPDIAKLMVSGADIWLNTPTRLHEASGTSGMKASMNGVLNLSTLDGWWVEAYGRDYESGWRIGPLAGAVPPEEHRKVDAEDLYTQLQYEVIPEYYYKDKVRWVRRMKNAIGLAAYFNTNRCIREYLEKAWK